MAELFSKKYINNSSGLQIFQLMRFCTLLVISVIFTKSGIDTDEIGTFEIFLFVTALLCSFWVNGIIQSFLPLYKNNKTFGISAKKSPEFFNVFILISLLSLTVAVFLLSLQGLFAKAFIPNNEIQFLELILCYIIFNCPTFLVEYIYLLQNKPDKILLYGFITFSIQLIVVATPAALGFEIFYSIIGLVAVAVFKYFWLIILLKKHALFKLSFHFIQEHLHFALPLIISSLMGTSAQYIDGFLVLDNFDSTTFAIFKYGAREFPLVLLMANALSTAMIPEFSKDVGFSDALTQLKKKSANLMHLLFPVSIVFLLGSEWIYPRLFNVNFTESAKIFNIYLLLIISRLVFPHSILIGLKKNKIVLYASFAELLLNVLLSVIFIQFWGIAGIAYATVIAYLFQKLIWVVYNSIRLKIPARQYIPLHEFVAYTILLLATFVTVSIF